MTKYPEIMGNCRYTIPPKIETSAITSYTESVESQNLAVGSLPFTDYQIQVQIGSIGSSQLADGREYFPLIIQKMLSPTQVDSKKNEISKQEVWERFPIESEVGSIV